MTSIQTSVLLRRVLLVDALSSGVMGLLLLTCSDPLAGLLDLPGAMLRAAGTILLPFALMLAFLGSRPRLPAAAVWAVIALNAIWVIDSLVLLFGEWVQPNPLGNIFIVGQAAFVAVMAQLEVIGLRRLRAAAAVN